MEAGSSSHLMRAKQKIQRPENQSLTKSFSRTQTFTEIAKVIPQRVKF